MTPTLDNISAHCRIHGDGHMQSTARRFYHHTAHLSFTQSAKNKHFVVLYPAVLWGIV